jgi:type II secretion system protein N
MAVNWRPNWTTWRPRLLYGAFFVVAFVLSLRWTLPSTAVRDRIAVEASQRGWQVEVSEIGPAGLLGVALVDVTLKDKDGLAIPVERVELTLPLWPLLTGKRRVALDARLWDGRVRGTFDLAAGPQAMDLSVESIDLARALPLRKASGLDLAGVATGRAHVLLPADDKSKMEGRLDLTVKEAGITGGQLQLGGLGAGLTVPRISAGEIVAGLAILAGKGTFEKLTATGGDLDLNADGLYFVVQPRLEFAPIFGKLRLKPSDGFATRPETRSFKAILDGTFGAAKAADGAYQLQVYGSLGHPLARPLPPGAN